MHTVENTSLVALDNSYSINETSSRIQEFSGTRLDAGNTISYTYSTSFSFERTYVAATVAGNITSSSSGASTSETFGDYPTGITDTSKTSGGSTSGSTGSYGGTEFYRAGSQATTYTKNGITSTAASTSTQVTTATDSNGSTTALSFTATYSRSTATSGSYTTTVASYGTYNTTNQHVVSRDSSVYASSGEYLWLMGAGGVVTAGTSAASAVSLYGLVATTIDKVLDVLDGSKQIVTATTVTVTNTTQTEATTTSEVSYAANANNFPHTNIAVSTATYATETTTTTSKTIRIMGVTTTTENAHLASWSDTTRIDTSATIPAVFALGGNVSTFANTTNIQTTATTEGYRSHFLGDTSFSSINTLASITEASGETQTTRIVTFAENRSHATWMLGGSREVAPLLADTFRNKRFQYLATASTENAGAYISTNAVSEHYWVGLYGQFRYAVFNAYTWQGSRTITLRTAAWSSTSALLTSGTTAYTLQGVLGGNGTHLFHGKFSPSGVGSYVWVGGGSPYGTAAVVGVAGPAKRLSGTAEAVVENAVFTASSHVRVQALSRYSVMNGTHVSNYGTSTYLFLSPTT